jgi:hypothetical protein
LILTPRRAAGRGKPQGSNAVPDPTIEDFGLALYGPDWKPHMEKLLGVEERTLRRWIAGSAPVPEGVIAELYQACEERTLLLDRIQSKKEEVGFQRQVGEMRRPAPRKRD